MCFEERQQLAEVLKLSLHHLHLVILPMLCEVKFRVQAKTGPGEVVCLVGSSAELGEWNPNNAIVMTKETKKVHSIDCDHSSATGDIWIHPLKLDATKTYFYRFFIGFICQSKCENGSQRHVLVKWWEACIKSRRCNPKEAVSVETDVILPEADVFGNFDGVEEVIYPGWLTDQMEIQLQFHAHPVYMYKPKYRAQTYSLKCTPIDHRYSDKVDDKSAKEMLCGCVWNCSYTDVLVSVLAKGYSKPMPQGSHGVIYNLDEFVTFYMQSIDPEFCGFKLDIYVHDKPSEQDTGARHVGFCCISPFDLTLSQGSKKLPIMGLNCHSIGYIAFDYLLIKPMVGCRFTMEQTLQFYWKSTRKPVDVGHRGLGSSYKCKRLAVLTENTIRSFQTAASHGADFVEFDVHLTKDEIPIIYHDFKVLITYRKKKRCDLDLLEIPVKDLTLAALHEIKLSHPSYKPEDRYEGIQDDDVDPADLQPFPTLQNVFESVDIHTGFNIEVKYPQEKLDGSGTISDYCDMNRFVDIILAVVFKHYNHRRIVFSSFSPEICSMLRLKQNMFPVLFLTQACCKRYVPYTDMRTQNVKIAAEFALSAGLLGVDVIADLLLEDMSLITYIQDAGLVLFVWGEMCNDKEVIQILKDNKVNGVIFDRIDIHKTGVKESIFKIEHQKKLLLHDTG